MTRSEFYTAYREARKLHRFIATFRDRLPGFYGLGFSLIQATQSDAYIAACRYGDRLQWPASRGISGRYRSRVR